METSAADRQLNILVAENNERNRQILCETIERYGCTFETADNGKTAVDLVLKDYFDLIFLDQHMPVMDGYETARAIREIEREGSDHTPIAVLSASIPMDDKEKDFAVQADYLLMKPYFPEEIYVILDEVSIRKNGRSGWRVKPDAEGEKTGHLSKSEMYRTFEKMDCDREFFAALLEKFKASSAELIVGIRNSISENNCEAVIQYTHALKGEFHIFNAAVPVRIAEALEAAVRTGCIPDGVDTVTGKLEEDIQDIIKSYSEFLSEE